MIEAALAHVVPNKVEAAYTRSDLFERRRLMDDLGRLSREWKPGGSAAAPLNAAPKTSAEPAPSPAPPAGAPS